MPSCHLLAVRAATTPLQCSRASLSRSRAQHQRRVLRTSASTTERAHCRAIPSLRSPLQWSHIVRLVRTPGAPLVPAGMTTDLKPSLVQARAHSGGHSHSHGGHHHQHDNTYLTSKNSSDPGVRITRIGLYVNLGMAIAKGAGGIVFNSQALTADALHALTDLVSDIMTLATISYSLRPASARFPTGYGKIESLGALGVSGFLLTGGFMIGIQSVMALSHQFFPEIAHILSNFGLFEHAHSHGHSHGGSELGPNINAAWLAGGSIIIKEWLYRATMKVAKQKRSNILASNAYHHRVDSLTAFVALLTITLSNFVSNAQWLDPVGGLIISGMILQAGWFNTKAALFELADVGIQDELKGKVQKAAEAALQEQAGSSANIKGVQGMKSGQNILVEVQVVAPSDWTIDRTNEIEQHVRSQIVTTVRGVRKVVVRFVSNTREEDTGFVNDFVSAQEARDSEPESGDHDHSHEGHNGTVTNGTPASASTASPKTTTVKRK